jgi:hypothetical protein
MPDYSDQSKLGLYPYDTRYRAIPAPTVGIFDAPTVGLCINVEWAGHVDGALERLLWPDAWEGDDATKQFAVSQITALLVSLMLRNECGMTCCDDIIAELDLIKAQLAKPARPSQSQIRITITQMQNDYHDYIINNYTNWGDDITNVYPQLSYGNSGDANRDKALCIICHRFVDLVSDWVIKNIDAKVANQQTVLAVTEFVAAAAGLGAWLFGELSYGTMFRNIQDTLDAEVPILSGWITSVSAGARSAFQDTVARDDVACAWYNVLKGATPTATSFVASISGLSLTGNAETIRAKIADALEPVTEPTQPSQEHVFFIFAALWDQAIQAAIQGIVLDDCLCEPVTVQNFTLINGYSYPSTLTFVGNPSGYSNRDIWRVTSRDDTVYTGYTGYDFRDVSGRCMKIVGIIAPSSECFAAGIPCSGGYVTYGAWPTGGELVEIGGNTRTPAHPNSGTDGAIFEFILEVV